MPNGIRPQTLYLRVSQRGLAFVLYEQHEQPSLVFHPHAVVSTASLAVNLKEILHTEPLAQERFESVRVTVDARYTLVPLNEFLEEDCETLFRYNFSYAEPMRTFYDTLPVSNAIVLFAMPESACRQIEDYLGDVTYTCTMTPVLSHFAQKNRSVVGKRQLYAYLHEQKMNVAAFEDGRLMLANTFSVLATDDVAYYLLFIFRQLGWNKAEDTILVAGENHERDEAVYTLRRYVKEVYPVNPTAEYNRHPVACRNDIPYDLTTLLLQVY